MLLSMLGITTLVIASGKVELIGEINNEPHAKETKTLDLKKELKTEAKLVANIKENNIVFDTELKYGAKVKESKFTLSDQLEGFVSLGYDNDQFATSVKYNFGEKETNLKALYKYENDKLTLKPTVRLKFDVLKPTRFALVFDSSYKFNDKLTLSNKTKVMTSINKMKDKIEAPEFLILKKIESDNVSMFGLDKKLTAEYVLNDEVKFIANANAVYETKAVDKISKLMVGKKEVKDVTLSQKTLELSADAKAQYESKELKTDLMMKYTYKNTVDYGKGTNGSEHKGTIISNKNLFELDTNASYDYNLLDGLTLTPALGINYKSNLTKFVGMSNGKTGNATLKENIFTVKPNAKASYKYDNFMASLNVELPVELSSKKYSDVKESELKDILEYKNKNIAKKLHDFDYEKTSLKATLSLGYSW